MMVKRSAQEAAIWSYLGDLMLLLHCAAFLTTGRAFGAVKDALSDGWKCACPQKGNSSVLL